MSTTADIKNGAVINFKNARMKIVEFQHVKPGKGPAFVRTKLKDIQSGKIIDHTFNSGAKIEFIRVTSRKFQYLYKDGDSFIFMDNNTYDQVQVDKLLMDNSSFYIKEGDNIEISFDGDEIMISTNKGRVIRVASKEIRTAGRNTQGVRIIKLSGDEKVVSAIKIDDNLI